MVTYAYDAETANEAQGFSAFGGHLLKQAGGAVAAYNGRAMEPLEALGIEDAEQLLAIAAIPGVREELQVVLGLEDQDFQSFLDQLQQSLPPERAIMVSAPFPTEFGLGVLAPTAEMMDAAEALAVEVPQAVALPASVNLIPYMAAIRNQGPRGTCVSFTLSALNEYILRRRGLVRDLSEQHLYYEIKLIDGAPNECGTWQLRAINALRNRGQCREVIWPYNPNPPCNNHGVRPAQARSDGLSYRLATVVVSPKNVLAYKTHMSMQRPVTLSIPVYNSWYQSAETRRSGRITMRVGNEPAVGGHAVCLVGYQDTPNSPGGGYFIVRNSWSTSWAHQSPFGAGYGTIPYQYITNDAMEAVTAPVPGIQTEDQVVEDQRDGEFQVDRRSTVTIEVGTNVKVIIAAS